MKYQIFLLVIIVWVFAVGSVFANSAPVVSSTTAIQRTDGSGIVDIAYNLSDADSDKCTVTVQVSEDGGSTWMVSATSFSPGSAIGANISPGNHHIAWNSKIDLPGVFGNNYRLKVIADDRYSPPLIENIVFISGGSFQMGDSKGDGFANELPVHTVTVDSFYMGKYEVTNGQYCQYLNSALSQGLITVTDGVVYKAGSGTSYSYCDTLISNSYSQITYSEGIFSVRTKAGRNMSNDPVIYVSWYGSAAYCNWRSQQEGKEPCYNLSTWVCDFNKYGYRLATEAEWEYAARGGLGGKRFAWGDTITHSQTNYYSTNSYSYDTSPTRGHHPVWNDGVYPYTSPAGSFPANGYGLYDIVGNAWEWCNDWYSSTYYSSSPTNNPTGPTSGSYRVCHGGGWFLVAEYCGVAYRGANNPNLRNYHSGFRVCLTGAVGYGLSNVFSIDNTLVARWNFNEGSGTTVTDSSGNSHDGTIYGATWDYGISGKALKYEVDDYISIPYSPQLQIDTNSTITMWVYVPNRTSQQTLLCQRKTGAGHATMWLELYQGHLRHLDDGTTRVENIYSTLFPENQWVFVSLRKDRTSHINYLGINGVEQSRDSSIGSLVQDNNPIYLGKSFWDNCFLHGRIDEVRIYNRLLLPDEISALYNLYLPSDPPTVSIPCDTITLTPEPYEDKLIVLIHGWQRPYYLFKIDKPRPDITDLWVHNMANTLNEMKASGELDSSWKIVVWNWIDQAYAPLETAISNSFEQGKLLAKNIIESKNNWQHVHLVAHSAGFSVLNTAAIKLVGARNEGRFIGNLHLTTLDGLAYGEAIERYASYLDSNQDWADNYYTHDSTDYLASMTSKNLIYAHNEDLSWVGDKHDFPHDWYHATITGFYPNSNDPLGNDNFFNGVRYGFPRSLEAGNWQESLNIPVGNSPSPLMDKMKSTAKGIASFAQELIINSEHGSVETISDSLRLLTGSPVWTKTLIQMDDNSNYISFTYQFDSPNNGYLTVYFNGNLILIGDQRFDGNELHKSDKIYVGDIREETNWLSIQLDPIGENLSSVLISNLETGIITNQADINSNLIVNFEDFAIFACRWSETGCNEQNNWCQECDLDQNGTVDVNDLNIIAANWLWKPVQRIKPDLNLSGNVDFADFSIFANQWMNTCQTPDWCYGCDFDKSEKVDIADLIEFAGKWLTGN